MVSKTPYMILEMVSKSQQKFQDSNQMNAFHSIMTTGNLYDLGYGI